MRFSGRGPSSALRAARRKKKIFYALKQRIEGGEVSLKHCPDASMPADFLTKWLGMPKVNKSIRYCTNARNAVRPESATNGNPQLSRSAEPGAPAGGGC